MKVDTGEVSHPGSPVNGLPQIPTEIIGGAQVAALSRRETAERMVDAALRAKGRKVPATVCSSVNGQVISELYTKANRREIAEQLARVYIVSVDGQPLVFASKLLGARGVQERAATTDLFHDVAEIAVEKGLTFYMLGASAEENKLAVDNARRQHPGLSIIGSRDGYFSTLSEEQAVVDELNRLKPDFVWVSMGFPRELEFCNRWCAELTNVGVMKTSGGLFNFLSGTRSRAPNWMQAAGLEWAYRLYLEPRRLFVRYAASNIVATWLLLTKTERYSSRQSA